MAPHLLLSQTSITTTYIYDDNNRLIKNNDITYTYDADGNLKEKTSAEETTKYFYDTENHLTRVETTRFGSTIVGEYEYDTEGKKMGRWGDGEQWAVSSG
jgi:YD repeat-containing protein